MAIKLNNVDFSYNDVKILDNVSLDVKYGEITLLSGLSGSGKSTVFNLISGIIPNMVKGSIKGEVLVNNENIINKPISYIARMVGSVLQNAEEQIIKSTVLDEIAFGQENLGFSKEQITKNIDYTTSLFKLDKYMNPRFLSGGEKQKLITSSTLAMETKIIMLDEPLANLDDNTSHLLLENLKKLANNGYAILIIEHRLDIVLDYVDTIYSIKNKKITKVIDKFQYLSSEAKMINNKVLDIKGELLFKLENINYSIKDKKILENINLDIYKGDRILIIGENGTGKTTLLKIIARLIEKYEGKNNQYILPKLKLNKTNKNWFKEIGYIYQNPNYQLFSSSVESEILFNGYSLEYCQEIVDRFEIANLLTKHPHSLSEGQKRKVTIASILASKPSVVLLDEPTVGQDYDGLNKIVNILNDIHEKNNNTMITITHDIRCAKALCNKVVWLENKSIYKTGGHELLDEYFKINN